MQKRLECTIFGRVQGVLFRDFVRRHARALGVTGFVRNQPDGTVEVVAEGEESILGQLLVFLHKGPLFANVLKINETWREATDRYTEFTIVYRDFWDRI